MKSEQKRKGNLLEDVVALLHSLPGAQVRCRQAVPVSDPSSTRTREIDVLVSFEVAGYPIRLAVECKNEKEPVGVQRIDEFFGKLADIGIPPNRGVFVSPVGFTGGALERASRAGIRALLLKGLTADRLAKEVNDAFQSLIYLTATWRQMTHFEYVPTDSLPGISVVLAPEQANMGIPALLTVLWQLWIHEQIPARIGEHTVSIKLPPTFAFCPGEPPVQNGIVIVDIEVVAHVATLKGTATCLHLHDASSAQLDKLRVDAQYPLTSGPIQLIPFKTETELSEYLRSGGVHLGLGRLRVPRIIHDKMYWPPSEEAVKRIRELRSAGQEISFLNVETDNLARAWQVPIWERNQ